MSDKATSPPSAGNILWTRPVLSWALYDWASSAYSTTVMAVFFPVFFKGYWSTSSNEVSNLQLGVANSAASLIILLLAPILGAIADRAGARKKMLLFFGLIGVVLTASLPLVAQGHWLLACAVYAAATIGFAGANIFNDSLLVSVAPPQKTDMVSAFAYALGYLGGGLLFGLNVLMMLWPQTFGLSGQEAAIKVSFVMVAIWWAVFALPLLFFVDEPPAVGSRVAKRPVRAAFRQLKTTFQHIRRLRMTFLFLLAYWLYIDGVDTILKMATAYGSSIGIDQTVLLKAMLLSQVVGLPAVLLFGWFAEKKGAKLGIFICLSVYIASTLYASVMSSSADFYLLAISIAVVLGGIQSLSRSFYARLIPPALAAEFYGFFNMMGKFAAVFGPVLLGVTGVAAGNVRLSIIVLVLMFVAGGILLYFVDEKEGELAAREFAGSAAKPASPPA